MPQTETGAPSPAPAQAANQGDGKAKTAANVSAAEAVLRFVKATEQPPPESTPPTADTPATSQEATSNDSSPAAESAPTDSPEATAETTTEGAPDSAEAETPTTEGEGEGEAEADEVLSPESQTLDAKTKEKIQRRIDKEVGKRKAQEAKTQQLETQLQQVQSQLQELATKQAQPTQEALPSTNLPPPPLPDVKDPQALDSYKKQIKTAARNIEALLDRDDIDQGVEFGDRKWTKVELKALMRDARVTLEDTIPEQERYFQQSAQVTNLRRQAQAAAHKEFPFLTDKAAPEQKLVQQLFQAVPMLNQAINGDYLAGLMVLGEQRRQELLAAKAKAEGKPAPKPAPVIPKPKPPASQTVSSTTGAPPARIAPNQGRAVPKPEGNQTAQRAAEILRQRDLARGQQ